MTVDNCQPSDLSAEIREEMYSLFRTHFQAQREGFESELNSKERVLLVRDPSGLQAFSTLTVFRPQQGVRVLFSGDTLVSPRARIGHHLPSLWADYVFRQLPPDDDKSYWLLLCSGYRTYRILPTFYRTWAPDCVDAELLELRDRWSKELFGERYHNGIVTPRWATPLHEPEPPYRLRTDPHVDFFLRHNPGYGVGHELSCLVSLEKRNLTPAGLRLAERRARATR